MSLETDFDSSIYDYKENPDDVMFESDSSNENSSRLSWVDNDSSSQKAYFNASSNTLPSESIEAQQVQQTLWKILTKLDKDERTVLVKVIGWGGVAEAKSLEETAIILGSSSNKTLLIYQSALEKVRNLNLDEEQRTILNNQPATIYDMRNSAEKFSGVKKIWYLHERI